VRRNETVRCDREDAMVRVVGADVWKNGWIAVATVDGWIASIDAYATMADLAAAEPDAVVIAVDIPIGLPVAPPRSADAAARRFIGSRGSSVFPTPPRDVLEADTYKAALAFSRKHYGIGLTAQSYALRTRILETDAVAREDDRVVEIHPEVTFRALAGRPLAFSKRTWNGHSERRRLLSGVGLSLPDRLPDGVGSVPTEDVLDATAAVWSAARYAAGDARTIPDEIPLPGFGQVIWY
jgi:predicted RNase H-like nuclease